MGETQLKVESCYFAKYSVWYYLNVIGFCWLLWIVCCFHFPYIIFLRRKAIQQHTDLVRLLSYTTPPAGVAPSRCRGFPDKNNGYTVNYMQLYNDRLCSANSARRRREVHTDLRNVLRLCRYIMGRMEAVNNSARRSQASEVVVAKLHGKVLHLHEVSSRLGKLRWSGDWELFDVQLLFGRPSFALHVTVWMHRVQVMLRKRPGSYNKRTQYLLDLSTEFSHEFKVAQSQCSFKRIHQ